MNNNIDEISNPNHDGKNIEQKEELKPLTGWLVDDEDQIRDLVETGTERMAGLSLRSFYSSDEALAQIKDAKDLPDFLIIDGNIRGSLLNGVGLIEEIKKALPPEKVPVIFTFTNDSDLEKEMLERGADFSLDKDPDKIFTTTFTFLSDVDMLRKKLAEIKAKRNVPPVIAQSLGE